MKYIVFRRWSFLMTLRLSRPTNSRVTRSPYWYCPLPLWSCRNTHCRQNPPGNLIWKVQIDFRVPSNKSWWSTWYHCQCWWIQTGGGQERRSQSDNSLNRRTPRLCRRAWRDINDDNRRCGKSSQNTDPEPRNAPNHPSWNTLTPWDSCIWTADSRARSCRGREPQT